MLIITIDLKNLEKRQFENEERFYKAYFEHKI